jgi:hypothetical protein
MAICETGSLLHWNYFLALESDVERLARFVEFTMSNFETHSIEMAHLFLAASSEVDVVVKQLCSLINPESNAGDIAAYRSVLLEGLPEMSGTDVLVPRYGLSLQPWDHWLHDKTPDWWHAYNKVKHQRGENFRLANLKNVLNSMAGLFVVNLFYHRATINDQILKPPPTLFMPSKKLATVCAVMGSGIALVFNQDGR